MIAISGIAKLFQGRLSDEYAAGLWKSQLPAELMWQTKRHRKTFRPAEYRAPSWSWCSLEGDVEFLHRPMLAETDSLKLLCNVRRVELELLDQHNPTGLLKGGFLELEGALHPVIPWHHGRVAHQSGGTGPLVLIGNSQAVQDYVELSSVRWKGDESEDDGTFSFEFVHEDGELSHLRDIQRPDLVGAYYLPVLAFEQDGFPYGMGLLLRKLEGQGETFTRIGVLIAIGENECILFPVDQKRSGQEKINTDIFTLTRYLNEEQTKHKEASGDFTLLCHALQFSFKSIAYYIRRASLINLSGLAGSSNITGDDQKKLDVIGNDIFIAAMRSSGRVRVLVSEEEEEAIIFEDNPNARYAVMCDPIDGSSNLDAGVAVGTIFGIYKLEEGAKGSKEDLLKPGTELVAAGFTMYGASAQLVLTMKGGAVQGFTMDNALGEFILTHPNMQMPKKRAIYSCNEGNTKYWEEPVLEWVNSLKQAEKPYSARYIGSMVADAYRTLLYGGIFAYPADKKSPKGKLRILYECAPMAMVFEQAGGLAVNSKMQRMLEVVPEGIHDRSGIFLGSYDEVQKVIDIHKKHGIGA
ncbi:hypothetical protein LTR08_004118 [Meristemomyces frigidus]|nr:hypothetical protein LTR08_004118 [Meristemomyces frigidus]